MSEQYVVPLAIRSKLEAVSRFEQLIEKSVVTELEFKSDAYFRLWRFDIWLCMRTLAGDNVEQRTQPWYDRRGHSVGGSQLGKILNDMDSSRMTEVIRSIVSQRAGDICRDSWEFKHSYFTWGTILESVSNEVLTRYGVNEQREAGSLWGEAWGHSNSVDGVAVVNFGTLRKHITGVVTGCSPSVRSPRDSDMCPTCWRDGECTCFGEDTWDDEFVVLEFKTPFSRSLDKMPPRDYIEQVRGGLSTVPMSTRGLLLEVVARRCPMEDLNFTPGYNKEGLRRNYPFKFPPQDEDPLGITVVIFEKVTPTPPLPSTAVGPPGIGDPYDKYEDLIEEYGLDEEIPKSVLKRMTRRLVRDFTKGSLGGVVDLGKGTWDKYTHACWLLSLGALRVRNTRVHMLEDGEFDFYETMSPLFNNNVIAFLGVKIFRTQITIIEPGCSPAAKIEKRINLTLRACDRFEDGEDLHDILQWMERAEPTRPEDMSETPVTRVQKILRREPLPWDETKCSELRGNCPYNPNPK